MAARVWTIIGCIVAAPVATALLAQPAAANSGQARRIQDGCEVGGGGNDIHSVQSRYDQGRNRIVVILRLCAQARRDAAYLLHVDYAAPFVEEAAATAACADPADAVLTHGPNGHRGVRRSAVRGNLVRFVVPLDALGVGGPGEVPVIPLWAESVAGGVVDHAPNRETGDGCEQPRARTETLVQTRAVSGLLAWVGRNPFNGQLPDGVDDAAIACTNEGQAAGLSGVFAGWFSGQGRYPVQFVPPGTGPFSTADGTLVAQSVADLGNCTKGTGGTDCLLAPIDSEVNGFPVKAGTLTWTGTLPNGTASTPNCVNWLTGSPGQSGNGGSVGEVGPGWTTGSVGPCNQIRYLICLQVGGEG